MRKIFLNRSGQIRSGWKISILFAGLAAAILISGLIMVVIMTGAELRSRLMPDTLFSLINKIQSDYTAFLLLNILQDSAIITVVLILWRLMDKKPLRAMGLMPVFKGIKDLASGLFLGIIAISTVFAALLLTGNITFTPRLDNPSLVSDLGSSLLMFIFAGLSEEILARGYLMAVLKQTGRRWLVVLLPSAIFALMHSLNPNVGILALANTFLVGVLFSYMVVRTANIWMPIGFHITWNYFQGNIFGFSVSGLALRGHALISTRYVKPNIVNGAAYGPEGGVVTTAVLLLFFVIVWKMVEEKKGYWLVKMPEGR